MYFTNKSVLLVSPQRWDHIPVSKHHYAEALVNVQADVFFLQPPIYASWFKSQIVKTDQGINVIEWSIPLPSWLKFKWSWISFKIMSFYLDKLLARIGQIDVVWNFDNGNYFKIRPIIDHTYKIFHPVDGINGLLDIDKYHLMLSVSQEILDSVTHPNKMLVPHGLRPGFLQKMNGKSAKVDKNFKSEVGYVGNIGHPSFELDWFLQLTRDLPEVNFHLWGSVDDSRQQLEKLLERGNVVHHGIIRNDKLFDEMSNMDALILLYNRSPLFAMDNSHKIIEYLSTGVPIVSTPLSFYERSNLFFQEDVYDGFLNRLIYVLSPEYEHNPLSGLDYARKNSYDKHLNYISECIEA